MAFPYYGNVFYDNGLSYLPNHCTLVVALVAEAFSYADATTASGTGTGKMLASAILTSSDFVIQNGTAPSKRECQFLGKQGTGIATGAPVGFAWLDVTNGLIIATTAVPASSGPNPAVTIGAGGQVTFPAIKFELQAPTLAN